MLDADLAGNASSSTLAGIYNQTNVNDSSIQHDIRFVTLEIKSNSMEEVKKLTILS